LNPARLGCLELFSTTYTSEREPLKPLNSLRDHENAAKPLTQQVLNEMKSDGSIDAILRRYL